MMSLEIAEELVDEIVPVETTVDRVKAAWMISAANEIGAARPEVADGLLAPHEQRGGGRIRRQRGEAETTAMLGLLGQPTPTVLTHLMSMVENGRRDMRIEAIRALAQFEEGARPATELLVEATNSSDHGIQWAAFIALGGIDNARSVEVFEDLRGNDPEFVEKWEQMMEALKALD